MTKWKRVWFFGKDKKDPTIDDYVTRYESEYGETIEVEYTYTMSTRWYMVSVSYPAFPLSTSLFSFDTLKEAKLFVEENRNNEFVNVA